MSINTIMDKETTMDEESIKASIRQEWREIKKAPRYIRNDFDFMYDLFVKNNRCILKYATIDIRSNRDYIIQFVKYDASSLEFVTEELRDDEEIVSIAVKKDAETFVFASSRLRDNFDIVSIAVNQNANALRFASDRLRDNFVIVSIAVKQIATTLRFASDKLRNDRAIVLIAVNVYAYALEHASGILRDDHEVVGMAVKQIAITLQFASERLRDDREIVSMAVINNSDALDFASDKLRDDYNIVLSAVMNNPYALIFASDRLRTNYEIILAAVNKCGYALKFASKRLQKDKLLNLIGTRNKPRKLHTKFESQFKFAHTFTDDIINNHIAIAKQPNVPVYTIVYDMTTKQITVTTMAGKEEILNNIDPTTTINTIGVRIYHNIHRKASKSTDQFSLAYKSDHICPLDGDKIIRHYIKPEQKGGSYNKYLKYKSKYLALKNSI